MAIDNMRHVKVEYERGRDNDAAGLCTGPLPRRRRSIERPRAHRALPQRHNATRDTHTMPQNNQAMQLDEKRMYRILLDSETSIYPDKKLAKALGEEKIKLAAFKNHDLSDDLKESLCAVKSDKTRVAVLSALKLTDKEVIEKKISQTFRREHDGAADVAEIVNSDLFKDRVKTPVAPETAMDKMAQISSENLQRLRDQRDDYSKQLHAIPRGAQYAELAAKFHDIAAEKYRNGDATHATNTAVANNILCTSDRGHIRDFAASVSNNKETGAKLTNTAETNTRLLKSHDYVFFNVYPDLYDDKKNELRGSTRYLKSEPGMKDSKEAPDARSYSYTLPDLIKDAKGPVLIALRDPVYPAGGTTSGSEEISKRLGQGIAEAGNYTQSPGKAVRDIGTVKDVYESHQNFFVGKDAVEALALNAQVGVLKTFVGMRGLSNNDPNRYTDQELQFHGKVSGAVNGDVHKPHDDKSQAAYRDDKTLEVLKMYQYPQLMVSGSVNIDKAVVFDPKQHARNAEQTATSTQQQEQARTQENRQAMRM
ncbi:hypothetical protein J5226_18485 [Lysobacter sp. K5869]|uniref:hypothetical protein n=1 Tax=Lysobacter sp. K5869 TaxID=2820808 RepID=UPI001C05F4D3|nr:hypothetical protein [Lysobacter sp. K5869]QWP75584.1 hypothetical protein J5226_18485 [Lysobacter sp. K5869]